MLQKRSARQRQAGLELRHSFQHLLCDAKAVQRLRHVLCVGIFVVGKFRAEHLVDESPAGRVCANGLLKLSMVPGKHAFQRR